MAICAFSSASSLSSWILAASKARPATADQIPTSTCSAAMAWVQANRTFSIWASVTLMRTSRPSVCLRSMASDRMASMRLTIMPGGMVNPREENSVAAADMSRLTAMSSRDAARSQRAFSTAGGSPVPPAHIRRSWANSSSRMVTL